MSGELRPEVEDWFHEACVDLEEAEDALSRGRNNWACFAAQQAAEKALKAAYLAIKRRRFPRTHDLLDLYLELRGDISVADEGKIGLLSSFYELSRYPNAGIRRPSRSMSGEVAREMLNLARELVRAVGERLGLACGSEGQGPQGSR